MTVVRCKQPSLLSDPSSMTITTATTGEVCGAQNGTASVTVTGGTSGYQYFWSDLLGQTTASATGLSSNLYFAAVTDANGCSLVGSAFVSSAPQMSVQDAFNNPVCAGESSGSISITASGGVSLYNYQWSTSETDASVTGLQAGIYSVTVTDNNACPYTASYTLTDPPPLSVTTAVTNLTCNGLCDGSGIAAASGVKHPMLIYGITCMSEIPNRDYVQEFTALPSRMIPVAAIQ